MGHLSDSSVPRRAESLICAAPAAELNAELNPRWLSLLGGAYGDVDAVSSDEMVLVEAFAREGKPLGGQRGEIARDALEIITLERHRRGARTVIAAADVAAVADSPARTGRRRW